MVLEDSARYTIETYTSPEGRYSFRVLSPTVTGDSSLEWGLEVADQQLFRENLASVVAQYEAKGSVTLVQGEPPIPAYLIPEGHG